MVREIEKINFHILLRNLLCLQATQRLSHFHLFTETAQSC